MTDAKSVKLDVHPRRPKGPRIAYQVRCGWSSRSWNFCFWRFWRRIGEIVTTDGILQARVRGIGRRGANDEEHRIVLTETKDVVHTLDKTTDEVNYRSSESIELSSQAHVPFAAAVQKDVPGRKFIPAAARAEPHSSMNVQLTSLFNSNFSLPQHHHGLHQHHRPNHPPPLANRRH